MKTEIIDGIEYKIIKLRPNQGARNCLICGQRKKNLIAVFCSEKCRRKGWVTLFRYRRQFRGKHLEEEYND